MTETNKIDWKLIFNTKIYHSIFIDNGDDGLSMKILFQHIEEIRLSKGFFLMLPTLTEYENNDKSQYLKKFPPLLKMFFDKNNNYQTLIITLDVFEVLIKQGSRHQIFQMLRQSGKNIVIFGVGNITQYLPDDEEYMFSHVTQEEWLSKINIFNRFDHIKTLVKDTKNPFKNPIESGEYLLDKNHD